jgi:hypothetical protein
VLVGRIAGLHVTVALTSGEARYFNRMGRLMVAGVAVPMDLVDVMETGYMSGKKLRTVESVVQRDAPEVLCDPWLAEVERVGPTELVDGEIHLGGAGFTAAYRAEAMIYRYRDRRWRVLRHHSDRYIESPQH